MLRRLHVFNGIVKKNHVIYLCLTVLLRWHNITYL